MKIASNASYSKEVIDLDRLFDPDSFSQQTIETIIDSFNDVIEVIKEPIRSVITSSPLLSQSKPQSSFRPGRFKPIYPAFMQPIIAHTVMPPPEPVLVPHHFVSSATSSTIYRPRSRAVPLKLGALERSVACHPQNMNTKERIRMNIKERLRKRILDGESSTSSVDIACSTVKDITSRLVQVGSIKSPKRSRRNSPPTVKPSVGEVSRDPVSHGELNWEEFFSSYAVDILGPDILIDNLAPANRLMSPAKPREDWEFSTPTYLNDYLPTSRSETSPSATSMASNDIFLDPICDVKPRNPDVERCVDYLHFEFSRPQYNNDFEDLFDPKHFF